MSEHGRNQLLLPDMHMVMFIRHTEMKIPGAGKAELVYTNEDGDRDT